MAAPGEPVPLFGPPTLKGRLPNILTAIRLVGTAIFIALLAMFDAGDPGTRWVLPVSIAIFVAAALTDMADGALARRWNVVSIFGRVMDPLADKLLILGAFIMLAAPSFAPNGTAPLTGVEPWMAVIVLARELLITHLRAVSERLGVDFSASMSGKLKMVVQSIAVPAILLLLWLVEPLETAVAINRVIAWVVVAVTVVSAIPYLRRAGVALRRSEAS